jgi:hypothetical protein
MPGGVAPVGDLVETGMAVETGDPVERIAVGEPVERIAVGDAVERIAVGDPVETGMPPAAFFTTPPTL